jgi:hypothetical protein
MQAEQVKELLEKRGLMIDGSFQHEGEMLR